MKTPEEIKRGLEMCAQTCFMCPEECPYMMTECSQGDKVMADALAYIRRLEKDNAQKDEHIMWLEMMNAEYKHVLRYIKHAADMGVHEGTDELALLGIHMGRGAEEEKHET